MFSNMDNIMNRKNLEKFGECMIHFIEMETKVSLCNNTPIVAFAMVLEPFCSL
jgi:hypothetical protein